MEGKDWVSICSASVCKRATSGVSEKTGCYFQDRTIASSHSSDEDVLKRHRAMFDRRVTMGRITGSLERQLWW